MADTEILLTHPTAAGLSAIMAQMSYKLSLNISNVIAHANGGIDVANLLFDNLLQ